MPLNPFHSDPVAMNGNNALKNEEAMRDKNTQSQIPHLDEGSCD
jgi:hypothetical protein